MMTEAEAYSAMFAFLDDYYRRTKSDDVGALLGSMSLMADGRPADDAIWAEWLASVARARAGTVDDAFRLGQ
ncbi:hypothetical protein SAMN06295905_0099 [Devosia lucknowensis]|uniref:Uncharacterized protein n=1 Tax=Devosia lucknowensis TaxID=1096929 RepID=A0A1Y6E774_9HYPH|nr:hypothetical protein [Devosia lucknowensis]SMQ58554.1 hypothetical protein SAMN06295905_0099 [Devosia lucknowensis]